MEDQYSIVTTANRAWAPKPAGNWRESAARADPRASPECEEWSSGRSMFSSRSKTHTFRRLGKSFFAINNFNVIMENEKENRMCIGRKNGWESRAVCI